MTCLAEILRNQEMRQRADALRTIRRLTSPSRRRHGVDRIPVVKEIIYSDEFKMLCQLAGLD